jgi:ribosomal protein S18 acetylase RimI-like enzyme
MPGSRPHFHADRLPLEAANGSIWQIDSPAPTGLADAAAVFASIDPWRRYDRTAADLLAMFEPAGGPDGAIRIVARDAGGAVAGLAVVQTPWLAGPYVRFLGVVPAHQGQGLGEALLGWIEAEARRARSRNLWICVSDFNTRALALYRRVGFEPVADLPDCAADGISEHFLRKRLTA